MPSTERHHRQRRRVVGLLLVAAVVAAPIAFYLVSPLFIRTTLVEAAPTGAADPTAVPVTSDATSKAPAGVEPSTAPSIATSPEPISTGPTVVAVGEFHGTDDVHFGSGTASIIESAPGRYTLRFEDFSVLNGPDLFVYLSPDPAGYADSAIELGRLKATDGAFNYDIPPGTDPATFASAIIWCKQFSHLFAVAPLVSG